MLIDQLIDLLNALQKVLDNNTCYNCQVRKTWRLCWTTPCSSKTLSQYETITLSKTPLKGIKSKVYLSKQRKMCLV